MKACVVVVVELQNPQALRGCAMVELSDVAGRQQSNLLQTCMATRSFAASLWESWN